MGRLWGVKCTKTPRGALKSRTTAYIRLYFVNPSHGLAGRYPANWSANRRARSATEFPPNWTHFSRFSFVFPKLIVGVLANRLRRMTSPPRILMSSADRSMPKYAKRIPQAFATPHFNFTKQAKRSELEGSTGWLMS